MSDDSQLDLSRILIRRLLGINVNVLIRLVRIEALHAVYIAMLCASLSVFIIRKSINIHPSSPLTVEFNLLK